MPTEFWNNVQLIFRTIYFYGIELGEKGKISHWNFACYMNRIDMVIPISLVIDQEPEYYRTLKPTKIHINSFKIISLPQFGHLKGKHMKSECLSGYYFGVSNIDIFETLSTLANVSTVVTVECWLACMMIQINWIVQTYIFHFSGFLNFQNKRQELILRDAFCFYVKLP